MINEAGILTENYHPSMSDKVQHISSMTQDYRHVPTHVLKQPLERHITGEGVNKHGVLQYSSLYPLLYDGTKGRKRDFHSESKMMICDWISLRVLWQPRAQRSLAQMNTAPFLAARVPDECNKFSNSVYGL